MTKEQEFIKSYGEYFVKTNELITLLFSNLNPNLSGDVAAEINQAFHAVADYMQIVEKLGTELANTPKFPVTLAN